MRHEPVKDHAERKRILSLIEQCEKEQTMSRYIDANEAEKLLRAGCAYAIWELPSIDIVRCKECKYFDGLDCNRFGESAECSNPWSDDGNDFCSFGERKEGE